MSQHRDRGTQAATAAYLAGNAPPDADEVREVEYWRLRSLAAEADSLLDHLTQLSNRRGFERFLDAEEARCRRSGSSAGVVVLDVDGLKAVNDTEGHAAGDRLLVAVAGVLSGSTRAQDGTARLGGDEFAVVVHDGGVAATAATVDRLCARLAASGVSASIGFAARDDRGLRGAWATADRRMYAVKRTRRGRPATTPATAPRSTAPPTTAPPTTAPPTTAPPTGGRTASGTGAPVRGRTCRALYAVD